MSGIAPGSLAETIYNLLAARDAAAAVRFFTGFGNSIFNRSPQSEVTALNCYWQDQLRSFQYNYNVNTIPVREWLCPSNAPEVWLNHFERHVLPSIIQHNLPV